MTGDECWVLGVDEVLVGQKLQYYIGLIRLIGLILGVDEVLRGGKLGYYGRIG